MSPFPVFVAMVLCKDLCFFVVPVEWFQLSLVLGTDSEYLGVLVMIIARNS